MAAKTASLSVNIIADAAKARAGLKEAETAFGKFSREVGNAQGAMGKFQAIGNSAFAAVKANAVAFATGTAAAIGTFVVKSVMGFQSLALEAGKFADATGLSTEQASRFIEVAGDIGVESAIVEKSIGFMNKTLGNTPGLFEDLNVEIERTSSGATDVNGTFLNVIDRLNKIEDPAARAAAGTRLLGRSWMELSEMVAMGATDLSAALASVADSKVITDEDKNNARDLRDEVDALKDAWEGFANNIGRTLLPALADAFNAVNKLIGAIDQLPGGADAFFAGGFENANKFVGIVEDLVGGLFDVGDETENTYVVTDKLKEAWIGGSQAMIDARAESDQLAASLRNQAEDVDIAKLRWDEFRNGLTIQQQSLRITENIEDFRAKWADTTDEAKLKSREYQQELLRIQIELGNAALAIIGLASTAQNTRIQLMIETGRLEQALSLIGAIRAGMNQLAGAVTPDRVERIVGQAPTGGAGTGKAPPKTPPKTPPKPPVRPAATYGGPKIQTKRIPGIATGGTITAGGMALVGEEGPELVNLPRGASVIPSIPSRKMMGGGQTIINIQVQAGLVSSPDQVGAQIIDAIKRAERRSGQVFSGI
jgi:hypothetical protein